jgi:hypothetical protein
MQESGEVALVPVVEWPLSERSARPLASDPDGWEN